MRRKNSRHPLRPDVKVQLARVVRGLTLNFNSTFVGSNPGVRTGGTSEEQLKRMLFKRPALRIHTPDKQVWQSNATRMRQMLRNLTIVFGAGCAQLKMAQSST